MSPPHALPRRPAGLFFDLDGTLVDAFDDLATAINLARRDLGLAALPVAEVRRRVGGGSEALVRALVPAARVDEALPRFAAHYEAHLLDRTRLLPGVEAVLERFGDRPLAVVTNKTHRFAERILAGLGVRGRFALVLGGDTLAEQKPSPLPLRHALERLGLPAAETVLVGDGLHDVGAARAAGLPVVAVTTGVERREALAAAGPDALVERLDELLRLFA